MYILSKYCRFRMVVSEKYAFLIISNVTGASKECD